jgi:hypothetical protein
MYAQLNELLTQRRIFYIVNNISLIIQRRFL